MATDNRPQDELGVATADAEPEIKVPKRYKVLILNDDYTPMDFVVLVLKQFFYKTNEQATKIMLQIHYEGHGTAGIYSADVAETKVAIVNDFSRANQHPLICKMEAE